VPHAGEQVVREGCNRRRHRVGLADASLGTSCHLRPERPWLCNELDHVVESASRHVARSLIAEQPVEPFDDNLRLYGAQSYNRKLWMGLSKEATCLPG
jgi:hypothetical protein